MTMSELVAVKRKWVPEWLWVWGKGDLWILPSSIVCYQPLRWIFTKPHTPR